MSGVSQRCQKWSQQLFVAGLALAIFACLPTDTTVGSDEVRRALAGSRWVQPRLSGLDDFEPCRSSGDLIPVTHCGAQLDSERLAGMREVLRRLAVQLAGQATGDQLHGAALARLALDSTRPSQIETAITYLREALARESNPGRQAVLLGDLAAAHLLLAEQLQGPLEVAAALEAALHALELDPDNPEAQFNRQLALMLLGIADHEPRSEGDTWIDELWQRLLPVEADRPDAESCPSVASFRSVLDAWASAPSAETWAPIAHLRACWAQTDDRFFAAILDRTTSDPETTALAWSTFAMAEAALSHLQVESVERELRSLEALRPPAPIALAALRLEAIVYYQRADYARAIALLEPLTKEATSAGFFQLAGEAHRLIALIALIRGEIREASYQLELASEAAHRACYPTLDAAIASLRIEILQKVGREDEAWRGVLENLRASSRENEKYLKLTALRVAALLAEDRGLGRVARALYNRGVELSETLGPAPWISSLRLRGELLSDLGEPELARADLALARKLLAERHIAPAIADTLKSDLLLLEGRTVEEPEQRRAALEALVASYRATEYDYRILTAELALARLQRSQGDSDAALATVGDALGELAKRVAGAGQWTVAPALVRAARPLAEELVALELEHRGAREVRESLAAVFGLRSGNAGVREGGALPFDQQRLTTFALPEEVVVLLESEGRLFLERRPIEREKLAELRERMLLQLRNHVDETRLRATSEPLGSLLLAPVIGHVAPGRALTIVADDVLAGLPFHLLPTGAPGELLLDRVPVSYATDLRVRRESPPPDTMLAVGISAASAGLPPLPAAISEAQEIAKLFPAATLLLDPDAELLVRALAHTQAAHLAGHFLVNTRSPLDSYLVLAGDGDSAQRLSLRQLLDTSSGPPRLLYLSACDTGRGLPPSAHGLASLAQAFASAGVERTVLTLWPLDDRIGKTLAVGFYRRLLAGEPAAEALRAAQLEHRGEHPSLWGPLAVVE